MPIPLNLSHAANLSARLEYILRGLNLESPSRLTLFLAPYFGSDSNPAEEERRTVVEEAARLVREIVGDLEVGKAGNDRVGQLIRNVFECLGLVEEGARISLRVGEKPDSPLRPR